MSKTIIYKNSTNKDANKGTNNNKDISRILVWFYLNARKIKRISGFKMNRKLLKKTSYLSKILNENI